MTNKREEIANNDQLVSYGAEVKALGDGKVGGYMIRFTDATRPDLTGEFFTVKSDIRVPPVMDVYYNHGLDKTLKDRVIGSAKTSRDEVGILAETQLNIRDAYEKAIYEMAQSFMLDFSSGSIPHLFNK